MSNTLKLGNGKWATGKDTLLSFSDTNNNYKPLPFSFSRASSATVVNKDGLIETVGSGVPRIDFKDNTKGALLLEPTRTNIVTKSENIQDWNKASNASAEFGYEDPFKGNKAVKLTSSSTAQSYQVYQGGGIMSIGPTYTYSIYAKKGTGYIFRLDFGIPDNGFIHIDLRDGSVLQQSGSAYYIGYKVESISNGWYRISMIATYNSSAYFRAGLYQQQGDCYVAFSQLEVGSYATSYIPTSGQANGVTRVADSTSQTVPDGVIGQTEGVLYVEFKFKGLSNSVSSMPISIDGSGSNEAYIYIDVNNIVYGQFIVGGSFTCNISGDALIVGNTYKIAFAYKNSSFALFVNGVLSASLNSGAVGANQNIRIGNYLNGNYPHDNINQAKIYNTRLSNAELQALTT